MKMPQPNYHRSQKRETPRPSPWPLPSKIPKAFSLNRFCLQINEAF